MATGPREIRVTARQAQVVRALRELGDTTAQFIAAHLAEHSVPVSLWLKQLERKGLVRRTGERAPTPLGRRGDVWTLDRVLPPLAVESALPLAGVHYPRTLHPAIKGTLVYGPSGRPVSPQRDREEWKLVRGPLMGSSDLAALLGRSQYAGPWQVWDRIVLDIWNEGESADQRRGNRQEANAIRRFEETFGLKTEPVGMISHPLDPRIVSDLDGLVLRPDVWPEQVTANSLWDHVREVCTGPGAMEVKTPRIARYFDYRDTGMMVEHSIQMQHHMEVAGLEWGVLTFYCPEYDASIAFPVVAEPKIGEWIRTQIPAWYAAYVDTKTRPMQPLPPPPKWPTKVPGDAKVRDDDEWMDLATLVAIRYYELKEATEAYEQTEQNLLKLLSDDEGDNHVVGGGVVVKRYQTPQQRRFDAKALVALMMVMQKDGDDAGLRALNPNDDRFYYRTEGKAKVEVTVIGGNPAETGGTW